MAEQAPTPPLITTLPNVIPDVAVKVYTEFSAEDKIMNNVIYETRGAFFGDPILRKNELYKKNEDIGEFYLNLYKKDPNLPNISKFDVESTTPVFSIAYGNVDGKNAPEPTVAISDPLYFYDNTPPKAIYSQMANVLLPEDQKLFVLKDGKTMTEFFAIILRRDSKRIDPGNIVLRLGYPSQFRKTIIDDSLASLSVNAGKTIRVMNLVEGEVDINGLSVPKQDSPSYGLAFPDLGIILIDADRLRENLDKDFERIVSKEWTYQVSTSQVFSYLAYFENEEVDNTNDPNVNPLTNLITPDAQRQFKVFSDFCVRDGSENFAFVSEIDGSVRAFTDSILRTKKPIRIRSIDSSKVQTSSSITSLLEINAYSYSATNQRTLLPRFESNSEIFGKFYGMKMIGMFSGRVKKGSLIFIKRNETVIYGNAQNQTFPSNFDTDRLDLFNLDDVISSTPAHLYLHRVNRDIVISGYGIVIGSFEGRITPFQFSQSNSQTINLFRIIPLSQAERTLFEQNSSNTSIPPVNPNYVAGEHDYGFDFLINDVVGHIHLQNSEMSLPFLITTNEDFSIYEFDDIPKPYVPQDLSNFPNRITLYPQLPVSENPVFNMNYVFFKFLERTLNDGGSLQIRSEEKINTSCFFVRIKHKDYNFSNNPSYIKNERGEFFHEDFHREPKTFITTIGLYNDNYELLAVAKLSRPLEKSFDKEHLIRVNLRY